MTRRERKEGGERDEEFASAHHGRRADKLIVVVNP